jgi:hypothetical protein
MMVVIRVVNRMSVINDKKSKYNTISGSKGPLHLFGNTSKVEYGNFNNIQTDNLQQKLFSEKRYFAFSDVICI